MLKIGVGPSSSHTLGPWVAAGTFARRVAGDRQFVRRAAAVTVDLYGSLALTGKGHATDIAIIMGLSGADPTTVPLLDIEATRLSVAASGRLRLAATGPEVAFAPHDAIRYHRQERLPAHANGMRFSLLDGAGAVLLAAVAYSVGGGFVVWDDGTAEGAGASGGGAASGVNDAEHVFRYATGAELLRACDVMDAPVHEVVRGSERRERTDAEIDAQLGRLWSVMAEAAFRGCTARGELPGGLSVTRRAPALAARALGGLVPQDRDAFIAAVSNASLDHAGTNTLVSAIALAVNEENAAMGRIVTAPTNGSAGVIPAVLFYLLMRRSGGPPAPSGAWERMAGAFLLTAGAVGAIFKHGATISAAMGGCQAEVGVSSAMAAAALTEALGGDPARALMAAEIAMEHHLGLTCDPINGLVQIPCIERNAMGAIKAIAAAHLALGSEAARAKVSLDDVVRTMWATAQDMSDRYKETSLGGLAVNVSVRLTEC